MRIGLNQQIQFPEITHGSITYDEYNVYCAGAKITINGEQHERMLELRTVMITMSEIDVEISPNRIIEPNSKFLVKQNLTKDWKLEIKKDYPLQLVINIVKDGKLPNQDDRKQLPPSS